MTIAPELSWPTSRLGEALRLVATEAGLDPRAAELPPPFPSRDEGDDEKVARWLARAAEWLELEAEEVEASYRDVPELLRTATPALVRIDSSKGWGWLVLVRAKKDRVLALGREGHRAWLPIEPLRDALCAHEVSLATDVDRVVGMAGLPPDRRETAKKALLAERLSENPIRGVYTVGLAPGTSFAKQVVQVGAVRKMGLILFAQACSYAMLLGSWWVLGGAALEGRLDTGWMLGWALLALAQVPLSYASGLAQARLTIDVGALLKRRLIAGALRLDPDAIRREGTGQLLGRVIEAEAVEALSLGAGFTVLVAIVEIIAAGFVLASGAAPLVMMPVFLVWVGLTVTLSLLLYRARVRWTDRRLALTGDLLDKMVGHRTRLAQLPREAWHDAEDESLEGYVTSARRMDGYSVLLGGLIGRAWFIVGLAALVPSLVEGGLSVGIVAVSVGGVLLAAGALGKIASGIATVAGAAIAWRKVAPMFHAAAQPPEGSRLASAVADAPSDGAGAPLLSLQGVGFAYAGRGVPVLDACDLELRLGDRVLLEGPSGAGKTTLAALVAGLREPSCGLLLLRGLDRESVGSERWREEIVSAPQFNDNHVMSATLAFNLLMGRRWPPTEQDLREAEAICQELDLGPLLERMPSGLQQMVGETGWQLSHGERSRVFIARALLQRAKLIILDESFAALDPETLRRALTCVLARARTLLVIAHP